MPREERKEYKKLSKFLKPSQNYREYRKALGKCELNNRLPWHGVYSYPNFVLGLTVLLPVVVHLHDIKTVMREDDVDVRFEPPLVNFEKWAHLKDVAMSSLCYGNMPLAYAGDLGMAMEYLKKGLQSVGAEEAVGDTLKRNSARLKEEEDKLRNVRGVVGRRTHSSDSS
jgi:hypothetical protein